MVKFSHNRYIITIVGENLRHANAFAEVLNIKLRLYLVIVQL